MANKIVCEVALPIPLDKTFYYSVPDSFTGNLKIGSRVKVDFRNRIKFAYCVGLHKHLNFETPLKQIISVVDELPLVTEKDIELAKWISRNYLCSLAQALNSIIPSPVRKSIKRKKTCQDTFKEIPVFKKNPPELTDEQMECVKIIKESIDKNLFAVFLLFGITGSGKTEVYLRAIEEVLKRNKQAIVLVPEISLTPQTVKRFRERFDDNDIAILHSYLSDSERKNEWLRIKENKVGIVIGARSAIFAPTQNLGLVVIDEEHENTFKQENTPRYHARETAIKKAQMFSATVILGSATPSIESYYKSLQSDYKLLTLTKRVDNLPLPEVQIVDMRQESYKRKESIVISNVLKSAISRALVEKKQVILFLNRRGFSTFVICQFCSEIVKCQRCDSPLILHKNHSDTLICHHCLKEYTLLQSCPKCSHSQLKFLGIGTQKVEDAVKRIFFETKTVRLDSDAVKSRARFKKIFSDLHSGNIGVLVGTQMVAKGLDFPDISVVGVISADTMLNLSDFRSSERTFQLLTQVAGRAGRSPISSKVYVQTYIPESISIQLASKQNYISFANLELENRKKYKYPPFVQLLRILLTGKDLEKVQMQAERIAKSFEGKDVECLGPAPCPNPKIKNRYRLHLLIKFKDMNVVYEIIKSSEKLLKSTKSIKITLDVDPVNLM